MIRENPKEKRTSDFIPLNGTGTVLMKDGSYRDVFVYGFFQKWHWQFIVHSYTEEDGFVTVSEASTGCQIKNEYYDTVEDALYFSSRFLDEKHYYLATTIQNKLVSTRCNLLGRNTTGLQTLAINSLLL